MAWLILICAIVCNMDSLLLAALAIITVLVLIDSIVMWKRISNLSNLLNHNCRDSGMELVAS
jgi:hypothetical protein